MGKEQLRECKLREIRYGVAGGSLDCLTFIFGPKTMELQGSCKVHHITRNIRAPPGCTYIEEPTEIYEID